MSEYPKQMLFITALSGHHGRIIPVEVLGPNPRINGGFYIRYPEGGSDTAYQEFLFEIPEQWAVLRQKLNQAQADVARLRVAASNYAATAHGSLHDRIAARYVLNEVLRSTSSDAFIKFKQAEAVGDAHDSLREEINNIPGTVLSRKEKHLLDGALRHVKQYAQRLRGEVSE